MRPDFVAGVVEGDVGGGACPAVGGADPLELVAERGDVRGVGLVADLAPGGVAAHGASLGVGIVRLGVANREVGGDGVELALLARREDLLVAGLDLLEPDRSPFSSPSQRAISSAWSKSSGVAGMAV